MRTQIKKSITLFFNAYWLVEYVMLVKYIKLYFRKPDKKRMLISMVDVRRQGKRLIDRFKLLRKLSKIKRLLRVLPLKRQIHMHANFYYIEEISRICGADYQ